MIFLSWVYRYTLYNINNEYHALDKANTKIIMNLELEGFSKTSTM